MILYQSEVCACKGKTYMPGRVYLGRAVCGSCGCLRPGPDDEVVQPPARTLLHDAEDTEDGRVTPSRERGARMSRYRMRRDVREAFDGTG